MKFGDLERSRDFLEERFGKNMKGFSRTATAFFSSHTNNEKCTKIKKCGVHLLCTQEVERLGFVEFEFSGRTTLYFESEDDDQEDEEMYSESEYEGVNKSMLMMFLLLLIGLGPIRIVVATVYSSLLWPKV